MVQFIQAQHRGPEQGSGPVAKDMLSGMSLEGLLRYDCVESDLYHTRIGSLSKFQGQRDSNKVVL